MISASYKQNKMSTDDMSEFISNKRNRDNVSVNQKTNYKAPSVSTKQLEKNLKQKEHKDYKDFTTKDKEVKEKQDKPKNDNKTNGNAGSHSLKPSNENFNKNKQQKPPMKELSVSDEKSQGIINK